MKPWLGLITLILSIFLYEVVYIRILEIYTPEEHIELIGMVIEKNSEQYIEYINVVGEVSYAGPVEDYYIGEEVQLFYYIEREILTRTPVPEIPKFILYIKYILMVFEGIGVILIIIWVVNNIMYKRAEIYPSNIKDIKLIDKGTYSLICELDGEYLVESGPISLIVSKERIIKSGLVHIIINKRNIRKSRIDLDSLILTEPEE